MFARDEGLYALSLDELSNGVCSRENVFEKRACHAA